MNTTPRLLACLLLATTTLAAAPFRFPRSTPEAEGVSSADILKFLDEAEPRVDGLNSFMLVRHGKVVAEGWWAPYAADEPHMMYSLSKSFTSTAIGGTEQHFIAAPGNWHKGGAIPTPTGPEPMAASGAWTSDYEYTLKLCGYRSTFTRTFRLRFADRQLLVDSGTNVGFGDTHPPTLTGTAD